MSVTQFAMVEELSSLVRDNIPCKHLLLSMEEMLVKFLQDGTRFSHKSIGEEEDRHLILECCSETSIPSILVSDLMWQQSEVQSPMILDIFNQKDVIQGQKDYAMTESSLEERRTAYLAARERIFSEDSWDERLRKNRPRHDPVVARRMITRALGQTTKATNHEFSLHTKEYELVANDVKIQSNRVGVPNSSTELEISSPSAKHPRSKTSSKVKNSSGSKLSDAANEGVFTNR